MKVIKDQNLSLLFKPWGYGDKHYLHLAVICGFDLLEPQHQISEQELWQKLPTLLPANLALDEAMPKVRGEFLLTGKCHAPVGKQIPAGRVRVTLGPLNKELQVFGDRHWQRNQAGLLTISEPKPFKALDLSYENAFGGPGFASNPLGKGHKQAGGEKPQALPNLELPGREIGSPTDQAPPASMDPLDRMWPQRLKKVGTYNDSWQQTRWPYFPVDMDYEFFNLAPADQRLTGFFAGTEKYTLAGLHPEHQLISNSLPAIRPRQFVEKKIDPRLGFKADNLIFEEVDLKLDTVWFFPEQLLGVLIFHGSTAIQDEEYLDLHRLYLARELRDSTPEDLAHHHEKMRASMDLSVPLDLTPFSEAEPRFKQMLRRWRNIPKEIEETKQRALGKAPVLQLSPAETGATLQQTIAESYPVLDKLEKMAREMHTEHGHRVKIDLQQFAAWRRRLANASQKTDELTAKAQQLQQQADTAEKKTGQLLKEQFTPEQLAQQGIDPENLLQSTATSPWADRAFALVREAKVKLAKHKDIREQLNRHGLEDKTIDRAWLGFNPQGFNLAVTELGLDPKEFGSEQITVPSGLVLPFFHEAKLERVVIRPLPNEMELEPAEEFVLAESAEPTPLFLPAALGKNTPLIVVTEPLTARLVEQEIGDCCGVLALPPQTSELPEELLQELTAAPQLLVISDGRQIQEQWPQLVIEHEQLRVLTIPDQHRSLFAASRQGLVIRPWLLQALPKAFAASHDIELGLGAKNDDGSFSVPKFSLPPVDIKGLIEKALAVITAEQQPKQAALQAKMDKILADSAEKLGVSLADLQQTAAASSQQRPTTPSELGDKFSALLGQERDRMAAGDQLSPENRRKFEEAIAQVKKDSIEAQNNFEQMQTRMATEKAQLAEQKAQLAAKRLPAGSSARFKEMGFDPDHHRLLSREEVITIHGRGGSLANYDLSELDLSGLDLSGANLSRARCPKTNFSNSRLVGATLNELMANEADFSKADLSGAEIERALFSKAKMDQCNFRQARINQVSFRDLELNGADFSQARLELVSIQDCRCEQTSFAEVQGKLLVFGSLTGDKISFKKMQGEKCLFQKCLLNGADFTEARLPSSMFMNCQGQEIVFFRADLSKTGFCQGCAFPAGDFRQIRLHNSCIKACNLAGADLRGSKMDGTLIEDCDLSGACLRKVVAPRTRLQRVNLADADLRGLNLLCGSLKRSRLTGADLSQANLYGVDLYKAVFGNTNLEGSNLKLTLLAGDRQKHLD